MSSRTTANRIPEEHIGYEPRCSGKGWALSKLATAPEVEPAEPLKVPASKGKRESRR